MSLIAYYKISFLQQSPAQGSSIPGLPQSTAGSSCETTQSSAVPPGVLGALAGLAVLAAPGILASAYLFWKLKRVTGFSRPSDQAPHPAMEAPRPFRMEAVAPLSATTATDDIYYPYSNVSPSAVSPSTNDRSTTSHTRGNYSTASASTANRITQADPPEYDEGLFTEQGAIHTQSRARRGNVKPRNV